MIFKIHSRCEIIGGKKTYREKRKKLSVKKEKQMQKRNDETFVNA
jgi:hypothetical protein